MWVNSKEAAAILGIKYDALQKATRRSEKSGKKFCSIKFHKLYFKYIDGRGGASGKVLQIWLDEQSENKLISKGYNIEDISDTRTSRAFAKQGLCCNPVSAQWQGGYQGSKDWQDDTTKETSPQPKSHKGSVNDEKYNKTSYESLDKSSQNKTMADKESKLGEFESGNIRNNKTIDDKANLVCEKWEKSDGKNSNFCNIHNMDGCAVDNGLGVKNGSFCYCETEDSGVCVTSDNRREIYINDEKNKANLQEIRNSHISSAKHNNADDSVEGFQSYAIEQKASPKDSLEELFDDMNINDDKKADAYLKAKVVKLWLKAKERKIKIDAFSSYININKMYDKKVSKGQIYDWARRYANGGIKWLVDERGGNRDGAANSKLAGVGKADWRADFANEYVEIDATTLDLFAKKIRLDLASAI
ncbi:hypothetical protein YZ82_02975 [Campylobacter hyointestinalis]|uniref:Uncharacterized protein n=1 Tax=Campylobacter hyointestinalis TaxID=198 RepID=A0A562XIF9_CAMHY|nr:hypothetical protein [Campylobacter hyointestinalis]TWO21964.1 hypothetical protein YZ82_02975 [Campylobacter hyointestinalis]